MCWGVTLCGDMLASQSISMRNDLFQVASSHFDDGPILHRGRHVQATARVYILFLPVRYTNIQTH